MAQRLQEKKEPIEKVVPKVTETIVRDRAGQFFDNHMKNYTISETATLADLESLRSLMEKNLRALGNDLTDSDKRAEAINKAIQSFLKTKPNSFLAKMINEGTDFSDPKIDFTDSNGKISGVKVTIPSEQIQDVKSVVKKYSNDVKSFRKLYLDKVVSACIPPKDKEFSSSTIEKPSFMSETEFTDFQKKMKAELDIDSDKEKKLPISVAMKGEDLFLQYKGGSAKVFN